MSTYHSSSYSFWLEMIATKNYLAHVRMYVFFCYGLAPMPIKQFWQSLIHSLWRMSNVFSHLTWSVGTHWRPFYDVFRHTFHSSGKFCPSASAAVENQHLGSDAAGRSLSGILCCLSDVAILCCLADVVILRVWFCDNVAILVVVIEETMWLNFLGANAQY